MSGLDLYTTQRALALMFVYASVTGFLLGGVYEGLRMLWALLGWQGEEADGTERLRWRVLLFFRDLLFMLVTSVTFILLCYYTNDGQLRAPAFVGMACGFFVYRFTLGILTRRLTPCFVRVVRSLVKLILTPIIFPIRWIGRWIMKALQGLRRRLKERRTPPRVPSELPPMSDTPTEAQTESPQSPE